MVIIDALLARIGCDDDDYSLFKEKLIARIPKTSRIDCGIQ